MVTSEGNRAFSAHVAIEYRGFGMAQVNDNEAVEHVGKFSIYVEPQQFPAYLGVLFQQDGEALAVGFDICNRL